MSINAISLVTRVVVVSFDSGDISRLDYNCRIVRVENSRDTRVLSRTNGVMTTKYTHRVAGRSRRDQGLTHVCVDRRVSGGKRFNFLYGVMFLKGSTTFFWSSTDLDSFGTFDVRTMKTLCFRQLFFHTSL